MLIKLTSDQIATYWEYLRDTLQESLPPFARYSEEVATRVQRELIAGNMDAFALLGKDEEGKVELVGFMITEFTYDIPTRSKNLVIYSLCGYTNIANELWRDLFQQLVRYAQANACKLIMAYTNVERLIRLAQNLGWDTSQRVVVFDLG